MENIWDTDVTATGPKMVQQDHRSPHQEKIPQKHIPEQSFIDEMNRIEELCEREAYGLSKYRVIHQTKSTSRFPHQSEILESFCHFSQTKEKSK